MDQHSPEWWAIRCGKITASRIGDIMARTQKGAYTAARGHYLREKVAERITGKPRDRRRVASLDARLELEPDARAAYEFYYDQKIDLIGFVEHPRIPNAGCSPDGLIGADGGIEIKCCDAEQHLEIITADAIEPGYLYQCHFNIACTERDWWAFVPFNPDMPEEAKVFRKIIERDEVVIASIESEAIEFLAEVDRKVEEVKAALRGSTTLETALEGSLSSFRLVH